MIKLILFVFLFIFTGTILKAQESVIFGVKGGVNFTKMNSKEFADNSNRVGFHVGLLAEVPLGNEFSIQPEVLYSTQGTKAEVIMFGGNPTVSFHLDYIQVPLVIKWYLTPSLALEAGPSFNFLVNNELGSQRVQPLESVPMFGIESDFGRRSNLAEFWAHPINLVTTFWVVRDMCMALQMPLTVILTIKPSIIMDSS